MRLPAPHWETLSQKPTKAPQNKLNYLRVEVSGASCSLLEMTFFLPRSAYHCKPSDSDGGSSGSLDTESPSDVWSPHSR